MGTPEFAACRSEVRVVPRLACALKIDVTSVALVTSPVECQGLERVGWKPWVTWQVTSRLTCELREEGQTVLC